MGKAECSICKLNPSGMLWNGCPKSDAGYFEFDGGCRDCKHKCREEAIYIGGMNICSKHSRALYNRLKEVFPLEIEAVKEKGTGDWHQAGPSKDNEIRKMRHQGMRTKR